MYIEPLTNPCNAKVKGDGLGGAAAGAPGGGDGTAGGAAMGGVDAGVSGGRGASGGAAGVGAGATGVGSGEDGGPPAPCADANRERTSETATTPWPSAHFRERKTNFNQIIRMSKAPCSGRCSNGRARSVPAQTLVGPGPRTVSIDVSVDARESPASGAHRTLTSADVSLSRACLFFVDTKTRVSQRFQRQEFPFSSACDDL